MTKTKRITCLLLALVLVFSALPFTVGAAETSVVQQRLEQISKIYPQDSAFDEWVSMEVAPNFTYEYGGCGGLMAYVTLKIFGTPYFDGSPDYSLVGSASTSDTAKMKAVFAKAKVGDVIEWRRGGGVAHWAVFMSDNADGVRIYEANFSGPNRVWYNHQWPWRYMGTWPAGGADTVCVYRSNNYNAVNKGTAAKEPAAGTVYEVLYRDNLKIKVVSSAIGNSYATLQSGYDKNNVPKYVAISDSGDAIDIYSSSEYAHYDANSFRIYTIISAPGKSKKVTATPSENSIKLSWKAVSGAAGYRIYQYNTKTKKWDKLKTTTSTSYTAKSLKAGTTYKFRIVSYSKFGSYVVWSNEMNSVKASTLPAVTSKISASPTETSIKLSWKAVTGATGYRVYQYNPSTKKWVKIKSTEKTSCTVKNLKAGTVYKFRVKAYKKFGGANLWGDTSDTFATATKPAKTTSLKLSKGSGKFIAKWAEVKGADGYQILYSTKKDMSGMKVVTVKDGDSVKKTVSSLKSGKTYYVKLRAYKTAGGKNIYGACTSKKKITVK